MILVLTTAIGDNASLEDRALSARATTERHWQGDGSTIVDNSPGDWTYHGKYGETGSQASARILVEEVDFGPGPQREGTVLREISPPADGGFLWGYTGGSPTRVAEALLADVLELPRVEALGNTDLGPGLEPLWVQIRNDLIMEVISQQCSEWRVRRCALLRWVRGWYADHGLSSVPAPALHVRVRDPRRD